MRPHRIVILAPTPAPYRAFEFDRIARMLAGQIEFHALFMERSWDAMQWQQDVPAHMPWDVLPATRLPRVLRRFPGLARANWGVAARLSQLDPDAVVVHGYDSPTAWAAFHWAWRRRRPVFFRSDSNIAAEVSASRKASWRWVKRRVLAWLFGRVQTFLTTGTANEKYYAFYGADPARFIRTSFSVDAETIARIAEDERRAGRPLKRELGIASARLLMFVGRLVDRKDPAILLQAMRRLLQRRPECDAAVLYVGAGPERSRLERLAAEMAGRVHFVGFRQPQDVARLFGVADAVALPSLYEPYGLVVNEAMAAGLPVIVSDRVGAAADLVVPGITGATFPAGDVERAADAIDAIFCAPGAAQRMGAAGREHLARWHRQFEVSDGYRRALALAIATRDRAVGQADRT